MKLLKPKEFVKVLQNPKTYKNKSEKYFVFSDLPTEGSAENFFEIGYFFRNGVYLPVHMRDNYKKRAVFGELDKASRDLGWVVLYIARSDDKIWPLTIKGIIYENKIFDDDISKKIKSGEIPLFEPQDPKKEYLEDICSIYKNMSPKIIKKKMREEEDCSSDIRELMSIKMLFNRSIELNEELYREEKDWLFQKISYLKEFLEDAYSFNYFDFIRNEQERMRKKFEEEDERRKFFKFPKRKKKKVR